VASRYEPDRRDITQRSLGLTEQQITLGSALIALKAEEWLHQNPAEDDGDPDDE
jgi:hypothetical protein